VTDAPPSRWPLVADISLVFAAACCYCLIFFIPWHLSEEPPMALDGAKVSVQGFQVPNNVITQVDFGNGGGVWDTSSGVYWAPGTNTKVLNGKPQASTPRLTAAFQWPMLPNDAVFQVVVCVNGVQAEPWQVFVPASKTITADVISERYNLPANGTVSVTVFQSSGVANVPVSISLSEEFP